MKEYNGQACVLPYWGDPQVEMDMVMNYQSNNNNVADTTSTTDIMNLRTHLQYSDQNVLDRQYCDDFVLDVFADEQD